MVLADSRMPRVTLMLTGNPSRADASTTGADMRNFPTASNSIKSTAIAVSIRPVHNCHFAVDTLFPTGPSIRTFWLLVAAMDMKPPVGLGYGHNLGNAVFQAVGTRICVTNLSSGVTRGSLV